jgi:hypothetical protein
MAVATGKCGKYGSPKEGLVVDPLLTPVFSVAPTRGYKAAYRSERSVKCDVF